MVMIHEEHAAMLWGKCGQIIPEQYFTTLLRV